MFVLLMMMGPAAVIAAGSRRAITQQAYDTDPALWPSHLVRGPVHSIHVRT